MGRGIIVTNGVDYAHASPLEFVMDSRLRGGLKRNKIYTIHPSDDGIFDSASGVWYGQFSHGLNWYPATLAIQNGVLGVGWQNSAVPNQPSVNADNRNVYYQCGTDTPLTIIVFGEKVSDS
jgi:hypothetical protein